MPGCSHPCHICADTQTLAHAYIHSGQIHEWEHARACTTRMRAHAHTHTHTRTNACAHTRTPAHTRTQTHTFWNAYVQREFISWTGCGMKEHSYTPCSFGLLLEKKKEKKTNSFTKYDTNLYPSPFFFASQWFQVNRFVLAVWTRLLTHPVTKSTSEVNRMRVPIEAQQHVMLFAILKPCLQDDRSCQQNSFVSCIDLRCASNMQYCFLAWSFNLFLAFFFLFPFVFRFFSRLILAEFFFLVLHNWWASACFAECKNDPLSWKHCALKVKNSASSLFFVLLWRGPEIEIESKSKYVV